MGAFVSGARVSAWSLLAAGLAAASVASAAPPPPNQVVVVPRPDQATAHGVSGINFDGSFIFGGASYTSAANRPYVWTGGATSTDLGAFISPVSGLPFAFNNLGAVGSNAVSDDGRVLVGTSSSSGTPGRAWIWREGSGYQDLGLPAGFGGLSAFAVSRDGTTVVGLTSLNQSRAYRWRAATGFEILGLPVIAGETYSATSALGTNGDGNVVVGTATRTVPTSVTLPFVWRAGTGFEIIATGYGTGAGQARAVSRDGTIIAGRAMPNAANERIFRRDAAGTILLIAPMVGDAWTEFRGMSADGARIVGISGNDAPTNGRQAILWTTAEGARSLNAIVAAANLPNAGLDLRLANGISGDGNTIIGTGRNAAGADLPFALRLITFTHVPTESRSLTQLIVPDAVLQNIRTTTYDTGVAGRLNGIEVFAARFNQMVEGPAVQQGFQDAAAAIRHAAGLRRVVIGAPERTRSETKVIAVTGPVETQIVENLPALVNTYATQGPATIATGDRGLCANPGDATTPPSGCSLPGTPLQITDTQINDNTHTANLQRITRVLTTTTEERLFEDWRVSGTLGTQIGTSHAIAGVLTLDTAERFTRRLLATRFAPPLKVETPKVAGDIWPKSGGASPYVALFEGYGLKSTFDGDAVSGIQSVDIDGEGLTAALAYDVSPAFTIGVAGELSRREAKIRDLFNPERAELETAQGGLFAVFREGRFSAAASLSGGRSAIDTRINEGGRVHRAGYDATIWSGALEAGLDLPLGEKLVLTPTAGAQWNRAELDGFAPSAPVGLIGKGTTLDATRVWAGLRASATFETESGAAFKPSAYVRYAHSEGDIDGHSNVAFAADPGRTLIARGPGTSRGALEVGAALDVAGTDDTTLSVGYDGAFADGRDRHEFKASLTVRF